MRPGIVIGCIGCATLLLGVVWWRSDSRAVARIQSAESALSEKEQALLTQVESLADEVRQLKQVRVSEPANTPLAAAVMPVVSPASHPAPNGPGVEPGPEEADLAEAEAKSKQQFETLERTLASEPKDAQWASTAQNALLDAYRGGDFAGAKVQAICKSTYCQVKFDLSGTENPMTAARLFAAKGPWPGPSIFKLDTVTNQGEYYVAREEHELPAN